MPFTEKLTVHIGVYTSIITVKKGLFNLDKYHNVSFDQIFKHLLWCRYPSCMMI